MISSLLAGLTAGQIVFLLLTAFVAGLARGFSGFGAALIFVPLAGATISPKLAAPILLMIDNVAAAALLPGAWRRAERSDVGVMALGAVLGVPLGAFALDRLPAISVRWGIAALALALLALLMSGWRYRGRPRIGATITVGGVAGFCSGVAQLGGPPVVAYWLGRETRADTTRANIILYFAVSSVLTTASYLVAGLLTIMVLALSALTGPAYGVGLALGAQVFGRARDATFRRVSYALIAIAAIASLPALDAALGR